MPQPSERLLTLDILTKVVEGEVTRMSECIRLAANTRFETDKMNGIEKNEKNRSMRPERILEMFLEVVQQHASKSYDFPISNLLDQYMQCRATPNFPEAAMVINSAGQVYSRKVDYLESLLMAMHDKQNASERTEKPDNPDEADKTEKKRLPGKRLKTANQTATTIHLASPKHIKKSSSTVEKMNLNSSDTSDSDRFKNYCQAVKSKIPVFYERVNLLISVSTDNNFDGSRSISKDDSDCQKNYNVFVGCISFKEKQIMSQREFLNRIQFDDLDGGFDQNNSIAPVTQDNVLNSTEINSNLEKLMTTVAGDLSTNNETDLLESLRDFDSAMFDDDHLNSFLHTSSINNTEQSIMNKDKSTDQSTNMDQSTINDTEQSTFNNDQSTINTDTSTLNNDESLVNNDQSAVNYDQSTINTDQSGMNNNQSTINNDQSIVSNTDQSTINNSTSGQDNTISIIGNETANNDAQNNPLSENGTQSDSFAIALNGTINGTSITDPQDIATPDVTTSANEALQENSAFEKAEIFDDTRNLFRIKEEYLKLNEVFRLPLSILEQEVNITKNIFGIPFGRLRRPVKFALPKDFDPFRTVNKRTKDIDECSTTTARKFVKLNDGSATPSIEVTAPSEQNILSTGDPLTDPSIVPASDTNTTENGATTTDGAAIGSVVGETSPDGNGLLIPEQITLEIPLTLVNVDKDSQDSAIADFGIADCLANDDEPSSPKATRLGSQSDALSTFDSGIGTSTEVSVSEGTIPQRRMSLDLTPPSEQIENELSTEADELSANRIQEMASLSEKVHSWHQRLKPILLHSENRNDFDVKETSRNIVGCFTNRDIPFKAVTVNKDVPDISFKDVMENRDKADTARYFFSMLQMANNQNIKITVNHDDSSKVCPQDQIKLKLLDPNIREIELCETK